MKFITRSLQHLIEQNLFKGKVVIVYGPRQVGKTTLVQSIVKTHQDIGLYLNCERPVVKQALSVLEPSRVKAYFGSARLIVLDEAQVVPRIGLLLKLLVDTYPDIQILATGSASFDLAQKTSEPLTGRVNQFLLYPLSLSEIARTVDKFQLEADLEKLMLFGAYPEVFLLDDRSARLRLDEIATHYLYQDVLAFTHLKNSRLLMDLLQLLALQLGQEVSYQELASQLGVSRQTTQFYLDLLEKSFVIFRLRAFSRNLRKEISKAFKVYFYDLGIRNSLIQNFNPLRLRSDVGGLWENLMIIERLKYHSATQTLANYYFWRTYDQQEIDFIEEKEGQLFAFEFKWSKIKKAKLPAKFSQSYKTSHFQVVNPQNFWSFVGVESQ